MKTGVASIRSPELDGDLAGLFAAVDGSVGRGLCTLTRAVADHVPFCCGASATLWEPDAGVAVGATPPDPAAVAEHQFLAGDGPVIAALRTGEPAVSPDILREDRWPEFAVAAMAGAAEDGRLQRTPEQPDAAIRSRPVVE